VVLFWGFSREGVTETLNHLRKLQAAGVQLKSFTEQYLDSTGLFREAIIGFLAAIAKQERVRLSERVKAGQARSTKKPGRPSIPIEVLASIREELAMVLANELPPASWVSLWPLSIEWHKPPLNERFVD
jgi:DNA invertase Pin-like site-specific DNA recombinase